MYPCASIGLLLTLSYVNVRTNSIMSSSNFASLFVPVSNPKLDDIVPIGVAASIERFRCPHVQLFPGGTVGLARKTTPLHRTQYCFTNSQVKGGQ
jgi:hypothetical protein